LEKKQIVKILNKTNLKKSGFTLIEILIVVSILTVFFTAAISVAIINLQNLKSSENKILATRYGEELIEWLRGEKEADWEDFIDKTGVWCFKNEPITQWPTNNECGDDDKITNTVFTRQAEIKYNASSISVEINITWVEVKNNLNLSLNTNFKEIK